MVGFLRPGRGVLGCAPCICVSVPMWDFETSEPNETSTHMHMHMHTDRACLLTLKEPLVQAEELLRRERATIQERLEVLQLRDSHAKTNQTRRYYSDKSNNLLVMIPINMFTDASSS